MKKISIFVIFVLALLTISCSGSKKTVKDSIDIVNLDDLKIYYAIEIEGNLCGFMEVNDKVIQRDNKPMVQRNINSFTYSSSLGNKPNSVIKTNYLIDPVNDKCYMLNISLKEGTNSSNSKIQIINDKAIIYSSDYGVKEIPISPEVIIGGDQLYRKLLQDFCEKGINNITYKTLDVERGEIVDATFRNAGVKSFKLKGDKTYATIIEQIDNYTYSENKYWIVPNLPYFAAMEIQNRKIYLSDSTILDKIK
jgi:hypothetical protein